jgi:hypothetical protein
MHHGVTAPRGPNAIEDDAFHVIERAQSSKTSSSEPKAL